MFGLTLPARLRDESGFIHKSFIGKAIGGIGKSIIGGIPIVGGVATSIIDRITGGGVPGVVGGGGCPPGFLLTPGGCVPRATGFLGGTAARSFLAERTGIRGGAPSAISTATGAPIPGVPFAGARQQNGAFDDPSQAQRVLRRQMGLLEDPAAFVPVMGRFGAGFEPETFVRDSRSCGRRGVLGADGICYNKGDLRNSDRWWPRGRRPLLTGGEMRAISTASSAAKKLQRKQKQLESLGLLKKAAPRTRRALPPGHTAQLSH